MSIILTIAALAGTWATTVNALDAAPVAQGWDEPACDVDVAQLIEPAALLNSEQQPATQVIPAEPVATAVTVVKAAPVDAAAIVTAEDLLDVLESANKDLVTLRAGIRIGTMKELQGDLQRRTGMVYYENRPALPEETVMPVRRFAVKFDELDNDGVVTKEDQTFVFTGRDLIERNDKQKFFSKRCVIKEGDTRDPLRIGEGPVPLPIGQKKADILQRFEVELWEPTRDLVWHVEGEQEQVEKSVAACKQLRLLPRPDAQMQGDIVEVRLWYKTNKAGEWLPRLAWTKNKAGDTTFVELYKLETNVEIDAGVMNVEKPEGNDWVVQEVGC